MISSSLLPGNLKYRRCSGIAGPGLPALSSYKTVQPFPQANDRVASWGRDLLRKARTDRQWYGWTMLHVLTTRNTDLSCSDSRPVRTSVTSMRISRKFQGEARVSYIDHSFREKHCMKTIPRRRQVREGSVTNGSSAGTHTTAYSYYYTEQDEAFHLLKMNLNRIHY